MKKALDLVEERILAAFNKRQINLGESSIFLQKPKLVAVSKLKPISDIIEAYHCGQRHFGENYIQELIEKSNSPEILEKCPEIKFHFIGHLQSNKVPKLTKIRNLYVVETVDSIKLADLINKAIERLQPNSVNTTTSKSDDEQNSAISWTMPADEQLRIMIQVNTSGEDQKGGCQMNEASNLAEHIANRCRWLNLIGLMTIGRYDGWGDNQPNLDFTRLYSIRETVSKQLNIEANKLELSMGMSGDFEEAIEQGSTSIRVGTMIFGQRPLKGQ